jgi:molybdenum cofactor cytidylyltransferase
MMEIPGARNLAVVLLAAGPSTRLGQLKQLVDVEGECLVRRSTRLALSLLPASVTVVSGCEAERVQAALEGLPVGIVFNRAWANGMGASINCGARFMPGNVDGVLLMVCDQWRLEETDLKRLFLQWSSDILRIYMASWNEGNALVSGPPVIFPRKLIPELKSMQENRGARQLVDRYMDIVEFVEMENAAWDLDRPDDLERVNRRSWHDPSN